MAAAYAPSHVQNRIVIKGWNMLKKRAKAFHAARNGCLICSKLDSWSEALPDGGATAAAGSAMAHGIQASEESSRVNYKPNCPAWHKP